MVTTEELRVELLRREAVEFPKVGHDDQVDAAPLPADEVPPNSANLSDLDDGSAALN